MQRRKPREQRKSRKKPKQRVTETTKREMAVKEKRAMVRVKYLEDGRMATIAVCPACWNIPDRRRVLLRKLEKMGLEVVYRADRQDGTYYSDRSHAPGCPYSRISADPWKRFEKNLKKFRR